MTDAIKTRTSPARLALAVKKLRAEKADLELLDSDPIAVIGMACRFPARSNSPEAYWATLIEGRSGIIEVPEGRWPDRAGLQPGQCCGGYLENIDEFDPAYFEISPREAHQIDPQHRLLLEVAWEGLWDAGIEPGSLAGSDTGVFVAIYNSDYARLHFRDLSGITAHAAFGTAHSIAPGRISFLLDLKGPNFAVDTGCSASLVATHAAVQSLRAHECSLAIVGGSSLKILPDEVLVFSKWGMLASDGKCKTFDAAADGFGPGEGSGVVVLKRLADALQDGDRIRAVIRGSAVNHDGRSTVLTAPNGLSQQAVIRSALRNARLEPHEIGFVEAHGTGTSLGDPIEMEALDAVYGGTGVEGDASPCLIGAVKTNFGHLEAAAGVAGLIKTVLCLENGVIPKNLHFQKLNPQIVLDGSRLAVAAEPVPWPRGTRPRVAGVSGFGISGTNAHIIVEEAPLLPANQVQRTIPLPKREWRRQRFWIPEKVSSKAPAAAIASSSMGYIHALLGRPVTSAFVKGRLFESELTSTSTLYFGDHCLDGQALLPFAAFLEIANAGARESRDGASLAVHDFILREPLFLSANPRKLQVLVADGSVEIASERETTWVKHAQGTLRNVEPISEVTDLSKLRARCREVIEPAEIYRQLEAAGLRFGRGFRVVEAAWRGSGESLTFLRLPKEMHEDAGKYGMHPALLDGCLQGVIAARKEESSDLFLPIALDEFHLSRRRQTELWVHTQLTHSDADAMTAKITVTDAAGVRVASLSGFQAKRTSLAVVRRAATVEAPSYELAWQANPLPPPSVHARTGERWLLIESEAGSCAGIADELSRRGGVCTIANPARAAQAMRESVWTAILYDSRSTGRTLDDAALWQRPERASVEFVLAFAKHLTAREDAATPRLWVISSCGFAVSPSDDVVLGQAPMLGILRTLAVEHTASMPVLMDTGAGGQLEVGEEAITREIGAGGLDPIVAFRGGMRYAARLIPYVPKPAGLRRLAIASPGRLDDLKFAPITRKEPEPHEIEIEVRTNGLNFRDVLNALGMFDARDPRFGAECAGTVARVGSAVRDFKPGQNVVAFAPHSFQSYVCVTEAYVTCMPNGMTFGEAASIPVAFLTAHYGLSRLAGLLSGQRILIHAAAGGLGLAAVQLARAAGAEIFATAGSEAKRDFLRKMGIRHVFDSRSLAFRSEVLEATNGTGVDVVLNSLADDFIRAGMEVVSHGGCFLEVGKRGIWTPQEVAAFRADIRYFAFDLGEVAAKNPDAIREMLRELMPQFEVGKLRPLRTTLYAMDDAVQAFRTMAQAAHVGKIVLAHGRMKKAGIREIVSNGTVLITGGLGALGGALAGWLAEMGARNLVLASRHAKDDHPVVLDLRKRGVEVAVEQVDVVSAEQMGTLLKRIRSEGPPLTAVFHAAGVVQDAVLAREDWSSYTSATATKLEGAWNLHRLTMRDPVKLMVLFSSAASILGSAGQGSYSAANAFLDALAHFRTSRGMETLSVNWGAWGSAGMAARLAPEHFARWERQGIRPLDASAAWSGMESAIEGQRTQVAIMDIDWERFLNNRAAKDIALFRELGRSPKPESSDAAAKVRAQDAILAAAAGDRKALLSLHIKDCARRVLSMDAEGAIQDGVPLQDIGLDSLMALELRNELAQSLGLTLSAGTLFNYPTVDELMEHLLTLLPATGDALVPGPGGKGEDLSALDSLSDEEAELLLLQELDGSGQKTHA